MRPSGNGRKRRFLCQEYDGFLAFIISYNNDMEPQKITSEHDTLLTAFAESRIGGRAENQDSYGWQDTPLGYLVSVCDGMGGGPGGKTASAMAVREILASVGEATGDEAPADMVARAVRRANQAIFDAGRQQPTLHGMGTTATVLLIGAQSAVVAHVGDSRVYQLREGKKVFRTFDHSLVFQQVAKGIITEEQARVSGRSNLITRALGICSSVDVEVHELPYLRGDRFLLCTDGIHGTMPEEHLIDMVADRQMSPCDVTDGVATLVDALGHSLGGRHDNLTLALVETHKDSAPQPK